jgi:predicted PurR-regulated permease PerM
MATLDPRGDGAGAVTTGGGPEPMARPAAVHPNASSHPRPDVPPMLGKLAAWSWRLLVVLTAAGLLLYLLILLKVIVVPVIVALFLATLLVPLVRWLEARGWKHLPAVLAVFGGAVLLIAAIIAGFVPLIGNELETLRQRADEGVAEVQRYIASRPFGLSEADLNRYLEQARQRFTENSSGLTRGAVQGATLVGEVITGLILCLFLTFFFVKDSERFTRWILDFNLPTSPLGRRFTSTLGPCRGGFRLRGPRARYRHATGPGTARPVPGSAGRPGRGPPRV